MKQELQEQLFAKYPTLFAQRELPPTQSLMCFGIECGDGWYGIIDGLCAILSKNPKIQFVQIKQKWGSLRAYVDSATDAEYHYIDAAEAISEYTCEECGSPFDVKMNGGWISPRCGVCRNHG